MGRCGGKVKVNFTFGRANSLLYIYQPSKSLIPKNQSHLFMWMLQLKLSSSFYSVISIIDILSLFSQGICIS